MPGAKKDQDSRPSALAIIGVIGLAFLLMALIGWMAVDYFSKFSPSEDPMLINVFRDHFRAVVGAPLAAIAAFVIVVLLRQTSGPIEFEGLGFKFKGASGQVMMWAICFAFLVTGLWMLW